MFVLGFKELQGTQDKWKIWECQDFVELLKESVPIPFEAGGSAGT